VGAALVVSRRGRCEAAHPHRTFGWRLRHRLHLVRLQRSAKFTTTTHHPTRSS